LFQRDHLIADKGVYPDLHVNRPICNKQKYWLSLHNIALSICSEKTPMTKTSSDFSYLAILGLLLTR